MRDRPPPRPPRPGALLAALLLLLALPRAAGGQEGEQERLEKLCASLRTDIEGWMGAPLGRDVPVQVVGREEVVGIARASEARHMPERQRRMAQLLAERLHAVPPGYDINERSLDLLRLMVAGLYDCDERRFYVVRGIAAEDPAEFAITAAHELVHAHRDAHTDYWERTLRLALEDSDAAFALRCLIEGDANLLGNAFAVAHLSGRPADEVLDIAVRQRRGSARDLQLSYFGPQLESFPAALRELLVAPYSYGQFFAAEVYRRDGREGLERAFRSPPRSMEQVLHPEKYLDESPDEPVVLSGGDPAAALGAGWSEAHADTLGEFDLAVLLAPLLGWARAERAAAGWDGARFHVCTAEGRPAFFGLASAWDSEEDAWQFARAWSEWASRRDPVAGARESVPGGWRVATREGVVLVRVAGASVFVADGVPEERGEAVLGALSSCSRSEGGPGGR